MYTYNQNSYFTSSSKKWVLPPLCYIALLFLFPSIYIFSMFIYFPINCQVMDFSVLLIHLSILILRLLRWHWIVCVSLRFWSDVSFVTGCKGSGNSSQPRCMLSSPWKITFSFSQVLANVSCHQNTKFLFRLIHKFCYFMRGLELWSCMSYKVGDTIEYNAEWLDFHCFSANWNLGTQITCSSNGPQLQKRDLTELSNQLLEISEVVFTQELFNAIVYSLQLSWRRFFWFLSW